jgi:hypothetical protein
MPSKPSFLSFAAMPPTLDVVRVFEWYRDNLGFQGDILPGNPPGYATLRRDDACIKFIPVPTLEELGWIPRGTTEEARRKWSGIKLTLPVRGIADLHEELKARGVKCTMIEARVVEPAGFSVTDPDGNTIEFQEVTGERPNGQGRAGRP